MNQLKLDLEETRRILDERGWCKFDGLSSDGKVCLEGAAAQATMGDPRLWPLRGDDDAGDITLRVRDLGDDCAHMVSIIAADGLRRYVQVLDALKSAIPPPLEFSVFSWNDRADRTVDEVKDLLDRAIEGCGGAT